VTFGCSEMNQKEFDKREKPCIDRFGKHISVGMVDIDERDIWGVAEILKKWDGIVFACPTRWWGFECSK